MVVVSIAYIPGPSLLNCYKHKQYILLTDTYLVFIVNILVLFLIVFLYEKPLYLNSHLCE